MTPQQPPERFVPRTLQLMADELEATTGVAPTIAYQPGGSVRLIHENSRVRAWCEFRQSRRGTAKRRWKEVDSGRSIRGIPTHPYGSLDNYMALFNRLGDDPSRLPPMADFPDVEPADGAPQWAAAVVDAWNHQIHHARDADSEVFFARDGDQGMLVIRSKTTQVRIDLLFPLDTNVPTPAQMSLRVRARDGRLATAEFDGPIPALAVLFNIRMPDTTRHSTDYNPLNPGTTASRTTATSVQVRNTTVRRV